MTTKKTGKKETEGEFDLGIGGIFKGLGEFVEKLGDLAEKGKELQKSGEIEGLGKKLNGVYGFSVKLWRSRWRQGKSRTLWQYTQG